jgi:hypothetical protein
MFITYGYGAIGRAIDYVLTHDRDLGMFSRCFVKVWDRDIIKNKLTNYSHEDLC